MVKETWHKGVYSKFRYGAARKIRYGRKIQDRRYQYNIIHLMKPSNFCKFRRCHKLKKKQSKYVNYSIFQTL